MTILKKLIELKVVKKGEEERVMHFINDAKLYLKEKGINQWQNGYPNMETVKKDVEFLRGFFILRDKISIGYVCIDFEGDK